MRPSQWIISAGSPIVKYLEKKKNWLRIPRPFGVGQKVWYSDNSAFPKVSKSFELFGSRLYLPLEICSWTALIANIQIKPRTEILLKALRIENITRGGVRDLRVLPEAPGTLVIQLIFIIEVKNNPYFRFIHSYFWAELPHIQIFEYFSWKKTTTFFLLWISLWYFPRPASRPWSFERSEKIELSRYQTFYCVINSHGDTVG